MVLKNAVEKELISADEAQALEKAMKNAGLEENMEAIFKKVRQFQPPDHFTPSHRFVFKSEIRVNEFSIPAPYGYVLNEDGERFGPSIKTHKEGFYFCIDTEHDDKLETMTAAVLCQQILASALPANDEERKNILPSEEKMKAMLEKMAKENPEIMLLVCEKMLTQMG